jgi:hypothetical protein
MATPRFKLPGNIERNLSKQELTELTGHWFDLDIGGEIGTIKAKILPDGPSVDRVWGAYSFQGTWIDEKTGKRVIGWYGEICPVEEVGAIMTREKQYHSHLFIKHNPVRRPTTLARKTDGKYELRGRKWGTFFHSPGSPDYDELENQLQQEYLDLWK